MKKILILILIATYSLLANSCSLESLGYLMNQNKKRLTFLDKSILLVPNHNEELKFYYSSKKELKMIEYKGFASTYSIELTYYLKDKNNMIVKIVKNNYTDYLGTKVVDIFSKQTTLIPFCSKYSFSDLNYNGLEEEYILLLKIKKYFTSSHLSSGITPSPTQTDK